MFLCLLLVGFDEGGGRFEISEGGGEFVLQKVDKAGIPKMLQEGDAVR